MAQPQPIEHFGKYQILERVAQGGMAEIYKARMEGIGGFNRLFAIKRILPNLSQNKEYIDLLVDEAKVAGLLSHANIVQILDLGEVSGQYYVAMEYVNGRDLGRVIARCNKRGITLPVPHSVFVLIEVLKGLEYAHNRQIMRGKTPMPLDIVHRDVSPSNVLLSFQGEVKLTDFGIAKARVKALETVSGVIKGKFDYLSPEQAMGQQLDPRTDLFAAGVLLYEMLCGVHPFRQGGDLKTIAKIKTGVYTAPTIANQDVPYSLELVLNRALALDPNERYQSATEFKEALTKFFHDAGFIFSHSTLAAFLKGLFPESSGRRRAKALELKDQHTLPMPIPKQPGPSGQDSSGPNSSEQASSAQDSSRQESSPDGLSTQINKSKSTTLAIPRPVPGAKGDAARVSFGPQPDDEDSFISLDSVSMASLTSELEEATETAAEVLLPNPMDQDPDPSRNFGPLSDPLDESTLLQPSASALMDAARRTEIRRASPAWADDNPTIIRPSGPAPISRQATEELPELELDEPTRNEPVPRQQQQLHQAPTRLQAPPPQRGPPQRGSAPQPLPRASTAATAPAPRMGRRTQALVAIFGIAGVAIGFLGGVLTGVFIDAYNYQPLPSTAPLKMEPRLLVTVPDGATLQMDGRPVPLAGSGSTPLTLRAGEPVQLRVSLPGHTTIEQSVSLDHNEERVLDFQLAQIKKTK
ncbi:MAG: serine/threonine protein kinase [Cognaticolwellia sp.]